MSETIECQQTILSVNVKSGVPSLGRSFLTDISQLLVVKFRGEDVISACA